MKKFALLLLFTFQVYLSHAQSLAYTQWLGTKPASINLWFNFDDDTLRYSTNGSLGSPLSKYYAQNGQFYIYDFSGTALCQDTGFYTYSISGNNLIFSLLLDNCTSRRTTLVNYTWTSLNTAISAESKEYEFKLWELPEREGIYSLLEPEFGGKILIYDLSGKLIYEQNIHSTHTTLDLSFLQKGIFIARFQSDKGNKSIKILR